MNSFNCPDCFSKKYLALVSKNFYAVVKCICHNVYYVVKCVYCQNQKVYFSEIEPDYSIVLFCQVCEQRLCFAKCPFSQCEILMAQQDEYRFGVQTNCINCYQQFKQIPCLCGSLNSFTKNINLQEIFTYITCCDCKISYSIMNCDNCTRLNYLKDDLTTYQLIQCLHCNYKVRLIQCINCKFVQKTTKIQFGQNLECGRCRTIYRYEQCPYCTFVWTQQFEQVKIRKKCGYPFCKKQFITKKCNRCQSTVIFKNINYHNKNLQEECKKCHSINVLYVNLDQEQKQNTEDSNQQKKKCVICLQNFPNIINKNCMHVSMCEKCLKEYAKRGSSKCPICRALGQFCTIYYN